MAAIFGIIQFGQEPIAERDFSAMRQAMEVIPATHREDWCSPQAAVGACADRELNHRAGDLPLVRELNGHAVVVVADARLLLHQAIDDHGTVLTTDVQFLPVVHACLGPLHLPYACGC